MHDEHVHVHGAGPASLGMALLLAVSVLLAVLYLVTVVREHLRGRPWSHWRTTGFMLGMTLVSVPLLPPLAPLAHHHLSAHMFQHLLLGMLGPIGIVLGRPVTLTLRALPVSAARRTVLFLQSQPVRWVSHPVSALLLNIGGMAALYLTPLYSSMAEHAALHVFVHLHFFAAGSLFSWAILQLEPAALHRISARARLVVLFVAIAAHATLAKVMYAYGFPRDTPHSLPEIEEAAQIMYYGGDFSELVLMVLLFATWPASAAKSSDLRGLADRSA